MLDERCPSEGAATLRCALRDERWAEVEAGAVSTKASDVYSAGKILLEMLASSQQFSDEFVREQVNAARVLSSL